MAPPSMHLALLLLSLISLASATPLTVDLGYSVYNGYYNAEFNLNIFKGIRYAAPPTGSLRWQAPQPVVQNRSQALPATDFRSRCPQGINAPTPSQVNFTRDIMGDEDCLFLNVYSPANAFNLPVFFYIQDGGGYAQLDGSFEPSLFMNANNNGFVSVVIQYRLGAFGFLAGDEVSKDGITNAGLLDQYQALQWVQGNIRKFGGNPAAVTIAGESAGGGSVLQQAIAYGGNDKLKHFRNIIASSPYLPPQYGATDPVPNEIYQEFATAAGCSHPSSGTVFSCLVNQNSDTLQKASYNVSSAGLYGMYRFLPVVDGSFITQLPTKQLSSGKINGLNALVGQNANEGAIFTPPGVDTEQDFEGFIQTYWPGMDSATRARLVKDYPSSDAPTNASAAKYQTNGVFGPSALNQSIFATGQQQRADASSPHLGLKLILFSDRSSTKQNLFAESTLICTAYWLAEAFGQIGKGFKYQFSMLPAIHGQDTFVIFPPGGVIQALFPADFMQAFQTAWGNFIIHSTPNPVGIPGIFEIFDPTPPYWPAYNHPRSPYQYIFNVSGDSVTVFPYQATPTTVIDLPILVGDTKMNLSVVDAYAFEAGRGGRCDLWRELAPLVPY